MKESKYLKEDGEDDKDNEEADDRGLEMFKKKSYKQ
jgi:hypothetical protein